MKQGLNWHRQVLLLCFKKAKKKERARRKKKFFFEDRRWREKKERKIEKDSTPQNFGSDGGVEDCVWLLIYIFITYFIIWKYSTFNLWLAQLCGLTVLCTGCSLREVKEIFFLVAPSFFHFFMAFLYVFHFFPW